MSQLTYGDVTRAAEELRSAGQKITLKNVRAQLERGSFREIHAFLKEWRDDNNNPIKRAEKVSEDATKHVTEIIAKYVLELSEKNTEHFKDQITLTNEALEFSKKETDAAIDMVRKLEQQVSEKNKEGEDLKVLVKSAEQQVAYLEREVKQEKQLREDAVKKYLEDIQTKINSIEEFRSQNEILKKEVLVLETRLAAFAHSSILRESAAPIP